MEEQEDTSQPASQPVGALTAMRDAAYSGQPLSDAMSVLNQPVVDPDTKWNAFAAGALKPATGGFGEAFGNALGEYTGAQQKEAELKAKYLPLVANAMIAKQMQSTQLAESQYKLQQGFKSGVDAVLIPLVNKKGPITRTDVVGALGDAVNSGTVPGWYAQNQLRTMPLDDPEAMSRYISGRWSRFPAAQAGPNELQQSLIARGVLPGTDEWNAAMADAQLKATNVPPTSIRGNTYWDAKAKKMVTLPSAPEPGYQNVLGEDGAWATVPVKGGLDAVTQATAATERGKPMTVVGANDAPKEVFRGDVLPQPKTQPGAPGNQGYTSDSMKILQDELKAEQAKQPKNPDDIARQQENVAALNREISRVQPSVSGVQTGPAPTDTLLRQSGQKTYDAISLDATQAQQDRQFLAEMEKLANSGAAFGPGTKGVARFMSLIGNAPLSDGVKNDLKSAQTAQDIMQKLASNMSMSRLGNNGATGTDAQLQTIINSVPHGEMTNAAMRQVIPLLRMQIDAREVRSTAANNWMHSHGNDLKAMQDFNAAWSKSADPETISIGRQLAQIQSAGNKDVQDRFVKKLSQRSDYAHIKENLGRLNEIGAF